MIILENELLEAGFALKGAELQTLKSKTSGLEYIWDGNPKDWAKHSPVLFPIVGGLKENKYIFEGKPYELPRHGFARDLEFVLESQTEDEVSFSLVSNAQTLKIYPFEFKLVLRYTLKSHGLNCSYEVTNTGNQDLLFSIGGHPAFATPVGNGINYEDYFLRFNQDEELVYHKIKDNLISDDLVSLSLKDKTLGLKHELFYDDALVFKNLKSNKITLQNKVNAHGLHFTFQDFPFFGIWSAKDANFICLEPWAGIADGVNHNQQLADKEGVVMLTPAESWFRNWQVDIF
jgi:galactose mutarotase-like enzyme